MRAEESEKSLDNERKSELILTGRIVRHCVDAFVGGAVDLGRVQLIFLSLRDNHDPVTVQLGDREHQVVQGLLAEFVEALLGFVGLLVGRRTRGLGHRRANRVADRRVGVLGNGRCIAAHWWTRGVVVTLLFDNG
jgi:Ethanolamine utilization protein EutJ (predicted chaperonin)